MTSSYFSLTSFAFSVIDELAGPPCILRMRRNQNQKQSMIFVQPSQLSGLLSLNLPYSKTITLSPSALMPSQQREQDGVKQVF